MKTKDVAKEFWASQEEYPAYPFIKERRLHELNYLAPKLRHSFSLLDLGCGDGALIKCLAELTDIMHFYAYDYAEGLMKDIPDYLNEARVSKAIYDCYSPTALPGTDTTIMGGLIQYLFEDEAVDNLMKTVRSPLLFVRSACTMKEQDELVNSKSEQLGSQYASNYRTLANTQALLSRHFNLVETVRIYPDNIESKFDTRQYYFMLTKKS